MGALGIQSFPAAISFSALPTGWPSAVWGGQLGALSRRLSKRPVWVDGAWKALNSPIFNL